MCSKYKKESYGMAVRNIGRKLGLQGTKICMIVIRPDSRDARLKDASLGDEDGATPKDLL
jgi:hypothetical protein